jgi:hypothetical protein
LRRRGVKISPTGVNVVWFRRDLTTRWQREDFRAASRGGDEAPAVGGATKRARIVWEEEV